MVFVKALKTGRPISPASETSPSSSVSITNTGRTLKTSIATSACSTNAASSYKRGAITATASKPTSSPYPPSALRGPHERRRYFDHTKLLEAHRIVPVVHLCALAERRPAILEDR